jgi:hypothetical protein
MPISENNNRILTIVSKETHTKVKSLAKEEKRSISSMASVLLEKGLESYEKK